MFTAAAIVSIALAVVLTASAGAKLVKDKAVMEIMARVEFPLENVWRLAVAELAGAIGLVVGLFWWPIGVAAAIGVTLYFVGAVIYHLRVHDKQLAPVTVLLLLAIAALTLRAITAG
jgi:hypothetical protein